MPTAVPAVTRPPILTNALLSSRLLISVRSPIPDCAPLAWNSAHFLTQWVFFFNARQHRRRRDVPLQFGAAERAMVSTLQRASFTPDTKEVGRYRVGCATEPGAIRLHRDRCGLHLRVSLAALLASPARSRNPLDAAGRAIVAEALHRPPNLVEPGPRSGRSAVRAPAGDPARRESAFVLSEPDSLLLNGR